MLLLPNFILSVFNIPHVPHIFKITNVPHVPWIHIIMRTLDIHSCYLSTFVIPYVPWVHAVILTQGCYLSIYYLIQYKLCTLDTHCYDDPAYMTLDIHCCCLSIYYLHSSYIIIIVFIITWVPWIHSVMMTRGIHCCYLSIYYLYLLYLIYLVYTPL